MYRQSVPSPTVLHGKSESRIRNGDTPMMVLSITDQAVITSGEYERYFEQDGHTYWHIMDPATGHPADSGLCSVTIVGDDGGTCDALSTSLFVMGLEKAPISWGKSKFLKRSS